MRRGLEGVRRAAAAVEGGAAVALDKHPLPPRQPLPCGTVVLGTDGRPSQAQQHQTRQQRPPAAPEPVTSHRLETSLAVEVEKALRHRHLRHHRTRQPGTVAVLDPSGTNWSWASWSSTGLRLRNGLPYGLTFGWRLNLKNGMRM